MNRIAIQESKFKVTEALSKDVGRAFARMGPEDEELKDVLVLAATNRLDMLDPAVLRPGRFDEIIEMPPPDEEDRFEIFKVHLGGNPMDEAVNVKELAVRTDGFSGAQIAHVCTKAALQAVRRAVEDVKSGSEDPTVAITAQDIEQGLVEVENSPAND